MGSYAGRIAIVTGGASGIGRELGKALLSRGAQVVLADVREDRLRETADALGAEAEVVDVVDADAVRALVAGVVERHGRLDFMFNNAGVAIMGESQDLSRDQWDRTIDVNVRGVVHGTLEAYEVMREQGSGHIVNTASVAGLLPNPGLVAYSLSKHAVMGLSKGLRVEAAKFGVRVTAVCPGMVDTPMARHIETVGLARDVIDQQLEESPIKLYPPERCAEDILEGVRKNRPIVVVTPHGKFLVWMYKWLPALTNWGLGKLIERSREQHAAARD